jgi:hypothetical protein
MRYAHNPEQCAQRLQTLGAGMFGCQELADELAARERQRVILLLR